MSALLLSLYPGILSALSAPSVLCIGETLFDGLPAGIYLGGAPLNVACHLSSLGVSASYASAVGSDRLGIEAVRRLRAKGVDTSLISVVDEAETGFVTALIDDDGDATYDFVTPAAWDFTSSSGVAEAAGAADAVVFGTLGARSDGTRTAINVAAGAATYAVCDVNLRPPFIDAAVVAGAARSADLLKLNDEELLPVAQMLLTTATAGSVSAALAETAIAAAAAAAETPEAGAIAKAAGSLAVAAGRASSVVVTRGECGAVLWEADGDIRTGGTAWACGGFLAPVIADTVGAGDAFLAALLASRLGADGDAAAALEAGCRLGAFVAGKPGATPMHQPEEIEQLRPAGGIVSGGVVEVDF